MATPTFLAALAVVGLLLFLSHEHRARLDKPSARVLAFSSLGLATAVALWGAFSVTTDRSPLVEADLSSESPVLELPADAPAMSLVVRGDLPRVRQGQQAGGSFELEVREGESLVARYDGSLEEHWASGRAGRSGKTSSLVTHDEERFDLPAEAVGHPMLVRLTRETGDLKGPVHVAAIPAPPAALTLGGLAAGAAALAAVADLLGEDRRGKRTRLGLFAAVIGAFGVTLLDGVTPHESPMAVVGALFLAVMTGLPSGLIVQGIVSAFLPGRATD